jgi:hypothetical protein
MKRMIVAIGTLAALMGSTLHAQDISGEWQGIIGSPPQSTRFILLDTALPRFENDLREVQARLASARAQTLSPRLPLPMAELMAGERQHDATHHSATR